MAKLKQASQQKVAKPGKAKLGNLTVSRFNYLHPEKMSSSKLKKRKPKTTWKNHISSSRSQQQLLVSPLNKTTVTSKVPLHLRSNSHQKRITHNNISIDTKIKANSKIEFYKPKIDISKKHANQEYEIVGVERQPPELKPDEGGDEEFALSIHENEEISLKSLKSKFWKHPPF